jgi:hypothetical protein
MIPLQILSVLFALGALYFSYLHWRRKEFTALEFAVWVLMWIGFIVVALSPSTFSPYVQALGFARVMDFGVMIGFVVMFVILLYCYSVVKRLQRRIEQLIRELALKDLEEKS